MLAIALYASSLILTPVGTQSNAGPVDACKAAEIMMGAHKAAPTGPEISKREGLLPTPQPDGRGPAVLLPDCKPEPTKRRKRKSDYPMV